MLPHTLVIFDFSGTLSLGAVEFGKPDRLQRHLEKSGLAAIGIDTADRYWQMVVNPTWSTASRSSAGFGSIAAEHIRAQGISTAPRQLIEGACSRFVEDYLQHSGIDPAWQPLLAEIQQTAQVVGLVATDHYAEASLAIQGHLAAFDIPANPIGERKGSVDQKAFVVANSADIGCPKADPRFWHTLRDTILPRSLKEVILVDDFGLSEQATDGYAHTDRIAKRVAATQKALEEVFQAAVRLIHFRIEGDPADAIAETVQIVRKALRT